MPVFEEYSLEIMNESESNTQSPAWSALSWERK